MSVSRLYDSVIGLMVGDALGVPVEFMERDTYPEVTGMIGYGTHNQPPGTWSDDSSMTIATVESMARCGRVDAGDIMNNFSRWFADGKFTPYGDAFDIGGATRRAIVRYMNGTDWSKCGGKTVMDNGNGALMRILPVAVMDPDRALEIAGLTHGHFISNLAIQIYTDFVQKMLTGSLPIECYSYVCSKYWPYVESSGIYRDFKRLLDINYPVYMWRRYELKSGGYVVDTLEAALWCLLTAESYTDAVLKAVNLGDDTDTTAAVTGGLAGLWFGTGAGPDSRGVPFEWAEYLPLSSDVLEWCLQCEMKFEHVLPPESEIKVYIHDINAEKHLIYGPGDELTENLFEMDPNSHQFMYTDVNSD